MAGCQSGQFAIDVPPDVFLSLMKAGEDARNSGEHQVIKTASGCQKLIHSSMIMNHSETENSISWSTRCAVESSSVVHQWSRESRASSTGSRPSKAAQVEPLPQVELHKCSRPQGTTPISSKHSVVRSLCKWLMCFAKQTNPAEVMPKSSWQEQSEDEHRSTKRYIAESDLNPGGATKFQL
jgi:hypothetical protein